MAQTDNIQNSDQGNVEAHRELYFNWIRQLITISGSALTALIALQGQYVPENASLLGCLGAALVSLLLALLCALYSLREEWSGPLRLAAKVRVARERAAAVHGRAVPVGRIAVTPPPIHHRAVVATQVLIVFAFALLCAFAIANLGKIGKPALPRSTSGESAATVRDKQSASGNQTPPTSAAPARK